MKLKERIVNLLGMCSLTATGIAAALEMKQNSVRCALCELRAAGVVQKAGQAVWELNPDRPTKPAPKPARTKRPADYISKPEPAHKPASKAVLPVRDGAFIAAPTRAQLMAGSAKVARV